MKFQNDNTLPRAIIKIFASEESTSISQILAWLKQMSLQSPLVSFPQKPVSTLHPIELSFHSKVLVEPFKFKPLTEGLRELLDSQVALHQLGTLPFPEPG